MITGDTNDTERVKEVKLVNAIKKHASPDHNTGRNSSIFQRGSSVIIFYNSYCMSRFIVIICLQSDAAKLSNSFNSHVILLDFYGFL